MLNDRLLYSKYIGRNASVGSVEAGHYVYAYAQAKAAGFEAGSDELKADLITAVKMQLRNREPSAPQVATEEVYEKLLDEMKLTKSEFEQLTHEIKVSAKFNQFEQTVQVNDNELFAEYCREKQAVRLRYIQYKSAIYLDKTKPAGDDRIKDFYEKNKDNKADMKDVLYTEAKMSGELLAIDGEKYLASLKPTETDLKAMYEREKAIKFLKPAGEQKPDDKYKPYDQVKADVEKDWRDERKFQVGSELSKIQKELEDARKDYAEVYALWHKNEPEAERTPFDTAAWLKSKGNYLTYWTTDELSEEKFAKGKKELNAKDAGWMTDAFRYAHIPPQYATQANAVKFFEQQFNSFTTSPTAIDPANKDKGYVVAHKLKFTDSGLKSLEDSKPAIVEWLKVLDAVDLAGEGRQAGRVRTGTRARTCRRSTTWTNSSPMRRRATTIRFRIRSSTHRTRAPASACPPRPSRSATCCRSNRRRRRPRPTSPISCRIRISMWASPSNTACPSSPISTRTPLGTAASTARSSNSRTPIR